MLPYFTRIKRYMYVIKPTCENFTSFRYFFYEKTVKCILHFCIHSNGWSFRLSRRKLIIGYYFTNYSKAITHQAEIFQGKLSTLVIFIPCKLCVNLWTFLFFGLTNVCPGALKKMVVNAFPMLTTIMLLQIITQYEEIVQNAKTKLVTWIMTVCYLNYR